MLKKIPPLALAVLTALTLALAPARDAAAWDKICMNLPFWHTWFLGSMNVVYGFEARDGALPGRYIAQDGKTQRLPDSLNSDHSMDPAKGRYESAVIGANSSACMNVDGRISAGEPFFVYLQVSLGKAIRCKNHHTNPNPWYRQQNRPHREIWYKGWGSAAHPNCEFTHEK